MMESLQKGPRAPTHSEVKRVVGPPSEKLSRHFWHEVMKTKEHLSHVATLAALFTTLGLQLAIAQSPAAFVMTDQPGYQPGKTVLITGGGFQAGEIVALQVLRTDIQVCPSPGHQPWEVVADDTGAVAA